MMSEMSSSAVLVFTYDLMFLFAVFLKTFRTVLETLRLVTMNGLILIMESLHCVSIESSA